MGRLYIVSYLLSNQQWVVYILGIVFVKSEYKQLRRHLRDKYPGASIYWAAALYRLGIYWLSTALNPSKTNPENKEKAVGEKFIT